MNVTRELRGFRDFLEMSWPIVSNFIQVESEVSDWMQANWELLVERKTCKNQAEFLEVYGDGADINGASSRVSLPTASPTHRIEVRPASNKIVLDKLSNKGINPVTLTFDGFVSWDGKHYSFEPSFHFVLLKDKDEIYVASVESVEFFLVAI